MVFSKAEKEPHEEPKKEEIPETEVTETRYMGEGPPGRVKGETETTETAYMGEPERREEHKHEKEYKRAGKRIGKANLPEHRGEERKSA